MRTIIKFEKNFLDDNHGEFGVIRLEFLSDGDNEHELEISGDVLKEYAPTILGKFIVAKYDAFVGDVRAHNPDEVIVGYIPPQAKISFIDTENGTFASVDGLISKVYAENVYKLYEEENYRAVSVEMMVEHEDNDESKPVKSFNITGVTLLGLDVEPSCHLANSKMIKFSAEDASTYYSNTYLLEKIKKSSNERRNKMAKSYKVNKSADKMSREPWGDVNKTVLRNKIMEASNRATLVNDVYLVVEKGWEDAPSEHLKYPVMQFKGDTLVYNRDGLASALGYAKAENNKEAIRKAEEIYKKLGLDKEGKETKMGNVKFSQLEGREVYGAVIERVHKKLGKDFYVEEIYSDHIEVRDMRTKEILDIPADITLGADDEDMKIRIDFDGMKKSTVQHQFAKDDIKGKKKLDDEEDDDIDEDEDDDDDEGKKKMSADANVDPVAYAKMLEEEAKRNKELLKKADDKDNIIMGLYKELNKLRKFKEEHEKEAKEVEVGSTLAQVQDYMEKSEYDKLKREGMECDLEDLDAWKNKVKSMAFEKLSAPKNMFKVGIPLEGFKKSKSLWDEI